ncbi:MAG: FAD-binding oxidoreductase [Gemmatimonadota bacterium]
MTTTTPPLADLLPERKGEPANWTVQGTAPEAVVEARSAEEVVRTLEAANAGGWAVEPAGVGTWLDSGRPPRRLDVVLTTHGLAGPPDHAPDDLTVAVDAGTPLGELQALLARQGQWLPLDPPGGDRGTIGALVATAAAGPLRHGYGTPRDHVLGVDVVAGDGRVLRFGGRVVKNVAGYDLTRLLVGSRGTLAVITRVNLRLHPLPERDATRLVRAPDAQALLALIRDVRERHVDLVALELLDPGASAHVAPDGGGSWLLAARAHGNEDAVAGTLEDFEALCANHGTGAHVDADPQVWRRLADVEANASLVVRFADRPASLDATLERARALAGGGAALAAHADGIVRVMFHSAAVAALDLDAFAARLNTDRDALSGHRGSVVLGSAPPDLAARFDPFGDPGPARRLMQGLKRTFDPAGVLSPGRFIFDAD